MTTIYLLRHGQSQHNAAVKSGGPFEPVDTLGSKLTDLGKLEAKKVASELAHIDFDKIYSSDYNRAYQTAQIIVENRNQEIIVNSLLRERNWGSLDGKNYGPVLEEIKKLQENLSDLEKMQIKLVEDMESELEGANRLKSVLDMIISESENQKVLVVNHGNIMRSFLTLIGFASYDNLVPGTINNCGYVVLEASKNKYKVLHHSGINLSPLLNIFH